MHGVLGRHERCDLAAAVELIALLEGIEGLVDLGLKLLGGERLGVVLVALQHAATGTFARVGGQEDFDLRVREHDGSDVATLGHDIAVLGGAALVNFRENLARALRMVLIWVVIALMLALPLASLDRLAAETRLADLGRTPPGETA